MERRRWAVLMIGIGLALGGCATGGGGGEREASVGASWDPTASRTVDGLERVEIDMPGVLYLRGDHGIGGYDEFLIPASVIDYRERSRKLPTEVEVEFLASLEQSLVYAAEDAKIPVVRYPGKCVMQVAMHLVDVSVDRRGRDALGSMTLLMEFRDAMSGEPLLRYATDHRVPVAEPGTSRLQQFRTAFDEMVRDMEISAALRAADLQDERPRPGCQGRLAERGRAVAPPVSAR